MLFTLLACISNRSSKIPFLTIHDTAMACASIFRRPERFKHDFAPPFPGYPSSFLTSEWLNWLLAPMLDKTRPMDNMKLSFKLPQVTTATLKSRCTYELWHQLRHSILLCVAPGHAAEGHQSFGASWRSGRPSTTSIDDLHPVQMPPVSPFCRRTRSGPTPSRGVCRPTCRLSS